MRIEEIKNATTNELREELTNVKVKLSVLDESTSTKDKVKLIQLNNRLVKELYIRGEINDLFE